jgi:thiamine-phosphate pyrophosphorylase
MDALTGRGIPVLDFARAVLEVRPPLVQLRAKQLGARDTLDLLRQIRPLASRANTLLFANDRPDLAVLGGCDGVHLGQEDPEPADVQRFWPALRIGISTNGPEQLEAALAQRPAYVACGPVFATRSKDCTEPVEGLEGLRRTVARASAAGCAVVAIGGIDLERAAEVGALGAVGSVIAALMPPVYSPRAVTERALELHRALGGELPDVRS